MGLFKTKDGCKILARGTFTLISGGVAGLIDGSNYNITVCTDYTQIDTIKLKHSQVKAVDFGTKTEITQKLTSGVTSAIAGGVLLGGVGAVVGATAGKKLKDKKKLKYYLNITYENKSGKLSNLLFEDTGLTVAQVYKAIKDNCHTDKDEYL